MRHQRGIDLDGRTFPRAIIHDGQHPNHFPGAHAITHKIHRPAFIRPSRCWASYYAIPADPPSLSNPHRQTFLAVQPVHALVGGRHPFAHQHRRQPAIAEPHAPGRQLFQAGSQFAVPLRFSRPIAMRRSSQSHQPAGVPLAHLVLHLDVAHDCPKSARRYQFFERTSFNARLSSVSSATTCFSFRFSSSSCFSRFASPLSIPPYFAFQR